jgi:AAA domain
MAPDDEGRPKAAHADPGQEIYQDGSTLTGRFSGPNPWAVDPIDDEHLDVDQATIATDDDEQDPTAKLQPQHLAELRALGVDDETISRLNAATYYDSRGPVGWAFDWTDGVDLVRALIPDRDKRRGPKVEWPKGQTLIVGCIRYVPGSRRHVIVEGPRQALAVAAYAPPDVSVWVMNGSNGIHRKIVDRLRKTFAGDEITIVTDADWRTNGQVGKAATEAAPEHLAQAGVVDVLIADLAGNGTDGVDDLVLATPEQDRAEVLAKILDDAKPARDRRLELETERELIRLEAREEARRQLAARDAAQLPAPTITSLAELLAEPDDAPVYRIDRLWPTGGNVILAAQRKAGKTTLAGSLIRCLADGDPFLAESGRRFASADPDRQGFDVTPFDGTIALLDLELDRRMLRRWLRDQAIGKTDRVMAESLRGRALLFDVLDDDRRQQWADYLAQHQVKVLILDPLGALLDAYGRDENSNSDVGPVLGALDALKDAAGMEELLIVHHFGHGPERSRGASKLRGWPDVEWFLYREKMANGEEPPPDAARFFAAEGRDVALTETKLDHDQATRRLWIAGGNRIQHQATKHGPAVLAIIEQHPGMSGREIVDQAQTTAGIPRDPARNAIRSLIADGKVRTEQGPKRAVLHFPVDPDQEQGR